MDLKFKDKGIIFANELLLSHDIALQYLDECKKEEKIIVGIDFFIVTPDGKREALLNGLDLSIILKNKDPNELVNITYEYSKRIIEKSFPNDATHATFVLYNE